MAEIINGKVICVNNEYEIVINKGSSDGVCKGNKFLVYRLGKEMFDPDTKESLGVLEIVCGEAVVQHLQEKITTLHTAKIKTKSNKVVKKSGTIFNNIVETYEPESYEIPFENVDTDCLVRQIK